METPEPLLVTTDSNLYSTRAELITNASNPSKNSTGDFKLDSGLFMSIAVISSLEIPMICLAIYAVYSLIKSKHAAPVFLINLLISDLIQIIWMLVFFSYKTVPDLPLIGIIWAGFTGNCFMTCIAVERYILITHPIWHRSHHSVKCFVCTSLTGWLLSLIIFPMIFTETALTFCMPFIFYPVIILCFVGSCRSLSHSVSFTPLKKQLVLAPLFFVVMTYTFLILPFNTTFTVCITSNNCQPTLMQLSLILYLLNPLVDCLLYVFMRSDAENIIRTPLCCSRLKRVRTETGQTTSTDVQHDHVRDSQQTADVSNSFMNVQ